MICILEDTSRNKKYIAENKINDKEINIYDLAIMLKTYTHILGVDHQYKIKILKSEINRNDYITLGTAMMFSMWQQVKENLSRLEY